jgi:hypothetical protein
MEDIMKKILFTFMLLLFLTGSAFAADVTFGGKVTSDGTGVTGQLISSMSANVGGQCLSSTANFACVLKHVSGTREFATSSADTKIYWGPVSSTNQGTQTMTLVLQSSTSADFYNGANGTSPL